MGKISSLAMNINAFDASELLEPILTGVRDKIDVINAIWQKKSYWKNPIDKTDYNELLRLKEIGLIDELIEFKPNFSKYSREQECDKRNMGIELMRKKGISHIISSDADELYDPVQFDNAKHIIENKGYTNTYCTYVNYYKDLDHYIVYPFKPFVPFIHSTYFKYKYNGSAPGPTDPTRRINNPYDLGTYIFKDEELRMHHLAWIRKDIRKKLINWSAKNHFEKEIIDKAVDRWNNWKEGDDAIMLFNVPNNSVKIKRLNKRLVNTKINF